MIMADGVILAKTAFQGTTGKENGARPRVTADASFFSVMGHEAGDPVVRKTLIRSAPAGVGGRAGRTAVAGAEPAAAFGTDVWIHIRVSVWFRIKCPGRIASFVSQYRFAKPRISEKIKTTIKTRTMLDLHIQ